jgi:hypothetical protein
MPHLCGQGSGGLLFGGSPLHNILVVLAVLIVAVVVLAGRSVCSRSPRGENLDGFQLIAKLGQVPRGIGKLIFVNNPSPEEVFVGFLRENLDRNLLVVGNGLRENFLVCSGVPSPFQLMLWAGEKHGFLTNVSPEGFLRWRRVVSHVKKCSYPFSWRVASVLGHRGKLPLVKMGILVLARLDIDCRVAYERPLDGNQGVMVDVVRSAQRQPLGPGNYTVGERDASSYPKWAAVSLVLKRILGLLCFVVGFFICKKSFEFMDTGKDFMGLALLVLALGVFAGWFWLWFGGHIVM